MQRFLFSLIVYFSCSRIKNVNLSLSTESAYKAPALYIYPVRYVAANAF